MDLSLRLPRRAVQARKQCPAPARATMPRTTDRGSVCPLILASQVARHPWWCARHARRCKGQGRRAQRGRPEREARQSFFATNVRASEQPCPCATAVTRAADLHSCSVGRAPTSWACHINRHTSRRRRSSSRLAPDITSLHHTAPACPSPHDDPPVRPAPLSPALVWRVAQGRRRQALERDRHDRDCGMHNTGAHPAARAHSPPCARLPSRAQLPARPCGLAQHCSHGACVCVLFRLMMVGLGAAEARRPLERHRPSASWDGAPRRDRARTTGLRATHGRRRSIRP